MDWRSDWCPSCKQSVTWTGRGHGCDMYMCTGCDDTWAACQACQVRLGQGCRQTANRAAYGHRHRTLAHAVSDGSGHDSSGHDSSGHDSIGHDSSAAAAVPVELSVCDTERIALAHSCTTAELELLGLPPHTSANDGQHGKVQWPKECSFFSDCSSYGVQRAKEKLVLDALTGGEHTDELLDLMPASFCEAALLQAQLVRDLTAGQREMLGAVMAASIDFAEERGAAAAAAQRDAIAVERERAVDALLPFLGGMQKTDAMMHASCAETAPIPSTAAFPYKLPTSPATMRRQLLDGAHSVIKALPRPEPQMVGDHSYVSLTSVVAHMLAHGPAGLDFLTGAAPACVRKRSESRQAQRVWESAIAGATDGMHPLVLWLIEWSDDFEPNVSAGACARARAGARAAAGACAAGSSPLPHHLLHLTIAVPNPLPTAVCQAEQGICVGICRVCLRAARVKHFRFYVPPQLRAEGI